MAAVKGIESDVNSSRSDIVFEVLKLDTFSNSKYILHVIV